MTTGCARRQLSGLGLGVVLGGCCVGLALVAGCNSAPPPVDTAAAVQAVKDADAAALKAAQALDANGMVSYYADDATVMPPNAPAMTDRASEQKAWAAMLAPGAKISWTPNKVESAASGEIVYEQGTYAVTVPGADGKWVDDKGKYLDVWKKQTDGSWKEEEDMWSSDLPAVAAAAVKAKKKG